MDLIYIPEVLTFGSFRGPQYRDYEQPWNRNYFNDGKPATYHHHRQQQQQQRKTSKKSCHLCKENKRRSLAAYIRGKARDNSCNEICEEEEEEENENGVQESSNTTTTADNKKEPEKNKKSTNA